MTSRLSYPLPSVSLRVDSILDIAPAWAGMPVGFSLLTYDHEQLVGFFDEHRRMTIGRRRLDESNWRFTQLPEQLGWDSHNGIAMAIDDDRYIHLSANMHCDPLVYFRSTRPLAVDSLERVEKMVGPGEQRMTFPEFLRGPSAELVYTYRDGESGNGNQIYNVYDHPSRTWRRLLDTPLVDGEGERNAYLVGPLIGPDGCCHLAWVWRETMDCATNHDLSYARSRDMIHWEDSSGNALNLPMTLGRCEIVDPVPVGGGLANRNIQIGFDSAGRPILSYHKHDASGFTQFYNARLKDAHWQISPASDWRYRWEFSGGGTIRYEMRVHPVFADQSGRLTQRFSHDKYGAGTWVLDPSTLLALDMIPDKGAPAALADVESGVPGMEVNWMNDTGKSGEPSVRYVLRWESLPENRDRASDQPPPPSMLRLVRLVES